LFLALYSLQKYKIESNSQHEAAKLEAETSCFLHFIRCKNIKLKAIHNDVVVILSCSPVVSCTLFAAKI
jgi:hypothetical protein